jgi:hypothetical protein
VIEHRGIVVGFVRARPRNAPRLELTLRTIVSVEPRETIVDRLYICACVVAEATVRAHALDQLLKED